MNTSNYNSVIAFSKNKAAKRQAEVLETIRIMYSRGIKITFYSVAQMTGASRSYLYGNEEISAEIIKYRSCNNVESTSDYNIQKLNKRIKSLEKEISTLQKYKKKYEQLKLENAELKKQLEVAYKY